MSCTLRKPKLSAALVLALPGIATGTAATAQTAQTATAPNPAVEAFMARLPDTLGGTPRLPGERKPGMPAMYFPRELMKDPLVMAMATPWDKPSSWAETRELVRDSFHESGIRKVLREGSFTVPDKPGAKTFFGEYLTGMGLKQYWMFEHDGIRANLIVTMFRAADRDRMRDEVAAKVFGGATIADGEPAAVAVAATTPEQQH